MLIAFGIGAQSEEEELNTFRQAVETLDSLACKQVRIVSNV
jgi:hypothetical protein